MSLPAGTRLGPYELLASLGQGGMGEVYRARDPRLSRDVAIKVLPADLAGDSERLSRFEQEARSASSLNHPNIITIHEIGTEDGISYIAMELVAGKTLRELLSAGPLPVRRLLPIAGQIADGLAKAHESGIVHRDLKPENVMVNKDGFVKILDFGLAKLAAPVSDGSSQLATLAGPGTRPGIVMGTVGYMSPEQASGEAVDFRSDQFALGSILYEMATGRRAFQKKTAIETLSAIIRENPEPIAAANPEAPAPLRWIVERCLAKEPEHRYAATRDLARDLKQTFEHLSEASVASAAVARPRRAPGLWWAAGLAALLLVGVADLIVRSRVGASGAAPATLRRLTFGPGLEDEPAFSPDGKFLAYTTDERGNLDVVVQPLGGGEPLRIASTDADEAQPAWSPDGSRIAYVSARDHGGRLGVALGVAALEPYLNTKLADIFLVPAMGGASVKLVEDASYPAWSPDGKRIAYLARRQDRFDLWSVSAEGGAATRLTDDDEFDYQPAYSPDGKWVAYGSGPLAGPHNLRVIPSAGGKTRVLTSDFVYVTRPSWSADSRAIFFAGERNGIANVWRLAFDDGRPGALTRVTLGQGQDANVSVSRDGRELAFANVRNEFNIWELTVATGQLRAVTSGSGNADYPQPSPDGKTLLLNSNRTGRRAVWTVDLNGRFLSQLTPGQTIEPAAHWSPDGGQIAYLDDHFDLRIQSVGSLNSRRIAPIAKSNFVDWSPDGKEIAAGNGEIVVCDVSSGAVRAVTAMKRELVGPSWSPDGKQIAFYLNRDPIRELFVVPSGGGTPRQLTRDQEDSHPAWSPTNPDEILFLRDHKRLAVISVSTGEIRWLPGYAEGSFILDYPAWSHDGKKIYFSVSRKTGDIFLLEGF